MTQYVNICDITCSLGIGAPLKLYNDWYLMMNTVHGVENIGELGRVALSCDCKMFYHALQCLHVWLVMHVEGKIDLEEVCEALPRRTKRSKSRLTLSPLLGNLCGRCEGEMEKGRKKKRKKKGEEGRGGERICGKGYGGGARGERNGGKRKRLRWRYSREWRRTRSGVAGRWSCHAHPRRRSSSRFSGVKVFVSRPINVIINVIAM